MFTYRQEQAQTVANVASLHCAYEARPLQTDRRSRGDRPGSGLAASDVSDYIVGSTIYVDGGMTLYPGFECGG
jgi:hypothetical protein